MNASMQDDGLDCQREESMRGEDGQESDNYLAAFQVKIRVSSVPGTTLVQQDP